MRALRAETALAACIIVGALAYLWADTALPSTRIGDPLGPKAFPALVGGGLILSGILLLLETWKKSRSVEFAAAAARTALPVDRRRQLVLCAMVAWTAVYYLAFDALGYLIATPIFLLGLLSHFHRRHHVANTIVAVGFTAVIYALFTLLLGVPLPTGPLPV
jgi:putative tricarboxylic transport membrane protein